jgi:hypothetical protein
MRRRIGMRRTSGNAMDIEWIKALAPVGTLLVGTAGFYLAWKSRRESQLRQADVLKWSLETIRLLQEVVLATDKGYAEPGLVTEEFCKALSASGDALSVAAEQGRLFFRNIPNSHGNKKEPAYRGLRPEILDQLIIAAQICREFSRQHPAAASTSLSGASRRAKVRVAGSI